MDSTKEFFFEIYFLILHFFPQKICVNNIFLIKIFETPNKCLGIGYLQTVCCRQSCKKFEEGVNPYYYNYRYVEQLQHTKPTPLPSWILHV